MQQLHPTLLQPLFDDHHVQTSEPEHEPDYSTIAPKCLRPVQQQSRPNTDILEDSSCCQYPDIIKAMMPLMAVIVLIMVSLRPRPPTVRTKVPNHSPSPPTSQRPSQLLPPHLINHTLLGARSDKTFWPWPCYTRPRPRVARPRPGLYGLKAAARPRSNITGPQYVAKV
jgi:hypothetical protein